MEITEFLSLLKGVKKSVNGWVALCPAHDDKKQSLSVSLSNDGKILMKCHANQECSAQDIVNALGLKMKNLFPDSTKQLRNKGTKKKIVAVYDYHDENGNFAYQVLRYEPKTFRQRRPDGKGAWIWNMKDTTYYPYRLPRLLKAIENGEIIYIVEGEKDVDNLFKIGLTATCNHGGAGKWRKCHTKHFRSGTRVAILPDNDEPGLKHAEEVARQLINQGCKVKIIKLPDIPAKGDVSDWLESHTKDELITITEETEFLEEPPPPESPPEEPKQNKTSEYMGFTLTDLGNAQRLVHRHGKDLRFLHLWGKWLLWNGTRWVKDDTGEIYRRAKDTVKSIYAEASEVDDAEKREAIAKHALKSESNLRIKAMCSLAESEPGIPITPDQLDANPWLLNCPNGVLDLQTGKLREHRREDYLTKIIPIEFTESATCPRWIEFLNQIMDGNQNLIDFLQKAVGYSMTGDTREQTLFFLYGLGSNGKSTFLDVIKKVLGDYAMQMSPDTLMMKDRGGGIPNDIARLRGARFVAASEIEEGRRLAEVQIKELTGGDTITARFLHQEFFEFKPEFKLFLAGNHKPRIKGTDEGIWRRIRLIPFTVIIPEDKRDKSLPDKLRNELPGILNWAIEGCLMWQREGLGMPDEVKAATDSYRSEMDVIAAFIEENCLINKQIITPAAQLYKTYTSWCEESGERAISQRAFGMKLTERGFTRTRGTGGRWTWQGIGILSDRIASDPSDPSDPDSHFFATREVNRRKNRESRSLRSLQSLNKESDENLSTGTDDKPW